MLKRGNISLVAAVIPGVIAYSGLFDTLMPAANLLFFILFGFAVVSFLLCLFEDEPELRQQQSKVQSPKPKEITAPELQGAGLVGVSAKPA